MPAKMGLRWRGAPIAMRAGMTKLALLLVASLFGSGCFAEAALEDDAESTGEGSDALAVDPEVPIAPDLNKNKSHNLGEASGMVASPNHAGFVWIHRDGLSTDRVSRERLYAAKIVNRKLVPFTGATGTYPTREFTFANGLALENINWEDIAIGKNAISDAGTSLYIGDVGNNKGSRNAYKIYQFAEPNPTASSAVVPALQATYKFAYPTSAKLSNGEWPNCETMFYLDRNLYIVTKESDPRVYRFPTSFHAQPNATHTLVPVVNGGTTRVVGAVGNPSYASFSSDRARFVIGGHKQFYVYEVSQPTLTGDALVKSVLLTPGSPEDANHAIASASAFPKLNTEGGTYVFGTHDVLLVTEGKLMFHWPAADAEE